MSPQTKSTDNEAEHEEKKDTPSSESAADVISSPSAPSDAAASSITSTEAALPTPPPPKHDVVSFSQMTDPSFTEEATPSSPLKGLFKFGGEARAYLVEYGIALIGIGTLLGVTISMLSTILKYDNSNYDGYLSSFAYKFSISMIATLIVVIPLVLLLTKRTMAVETRAPAIKSSGWRKGFLGFFLLNVALWGIGFAIAFMYDLISFFAGFGISESNSLPWRSLLVNAVAAGLLLFTMWLYGHDYREQNNTKPLLGQLLKFGLTGFAVLLTLVYMGTAFKSQRASFVDDAISEDLSSIQSKISSYQAAHQERLPNSLNDITLNDQQQARSKKYEYSFDKSSSGYELCAIFKTDTKSKQKDKGSQNALETFSDSAYGYTNEPDKSNPRIHETGKQCFETKTQSNIYDPLLYDDTGGASSAIDSTSDTNTSSVYDQGAVLQRGAVLQPAATAPGAPSAASPNNSGIRNFVDAIKRNF